jgi:hypothetical protein
MQKKPEISARGSCAFRAACQCFRRTARRFLNQARFDVSYAGFFHDDQA